MATAVTPITDQVPTVADWADLNDTMSNGDPREIDTGTAEIIDTDRLQFVSVTTSAAATTTAQVLACQLDLDAGVHYYLEGYVTLEKSQADTTDDNPRVGLKFSNNVLFMWMVSTLVPDWDASPKIVEETDAFQSSGDLPIAAGQANDNVTFTAPYVRVFGILVAQESGTVEFYLEKQADVNNTEYKFANYTYLSAERIRV